FSIAMKTLDRSRPNIAAQALGVAQGAFDYALGYIQERQQFGRPVASFQGLQFMLAEMATEIEAARGLTYQAAIRVHEEGKDGARLVTANRYSAMAKMYATDVAMRVTTDAVQLLGGYGIMRDYPVERMMRDAKIFQIYEGTNQIQKMVIGMSFLGGAKGWRARSRTAPCRLPRKGAAPPGGHVFMITSRGWRCPRRIPWAPSMCSSFSDAA